MKLWTIRNEQLAAFESALERRFVDETMIQLRRKYPEVCARLDSAAIRASIDTALEKRAAYRFETPETVRLYLDLMYLLGFDFDGSPRRRWVRKTLTDFDLGPRTRLSLLVDEARALAPGGRGLPA